MFNIAVLAYALSSPEQPAAEASTATAQGTKETAFLGGVGALGGDAAGGMAVSLAGLHRIGFVEVGAELYGAALFSAVGGAGGLAGLHLGDNFSMRALLAGGVHGYDGVGHGILSKDPGVGGALPYVGGRLVLGYSPGERRMFYGLMGMMDEDLDRERKSVTYEEEGWLSGNRYETTSDHTIGQTTWGALFVMGRQFDLASY